MKFILSDVLSTGKLCQLPRRDNPRDTTSVIRNLRTSALSGTGALYRQLEITSYQSNIYSLYVRMLYKGVMEELVNCKAICNYTQLRNISPKYKCFNIGDI